MLQTRFDTMTCISHSFAKVHLKHHFITIHDVLVEARLLTFLRPLHMFLYILRRWMLPDIGFSPSASVETALNGFHVRSRFPVRVILLTASQLKERRQRPVYKYARMSRNRKSFAIACKRERVFRKSVLDRNYD